MVNILFFLFHFSIISTFIQIGSGHTVPKNPRNPSNNKLGQIIAKKDAGKYGFLEAPLVRQADNELKNR